jgi:hypothetical protein
VALERLYWGKTHFPYSGQLRPLPPLLNRPCTLSESQNSRAESKKKKTRGETQYETATYRAFCVCVTRHVCISYSMGGLVWAVRRQPLPPPDRNSSWSSSLSRHRAAAQRVQ